MSVLSKPPLCDVTAKGRQQNEIVNYRTRFVGVLSYIHCLKLRFKLLINLSLHCEGDHILSNTNVSKDFSEVSLKVK